MDQNTYTRKCPSCELEIFYKNKKSFANANKKGNVCKKCVYRLSLGKMRFDGANNPFYGKKHSSATKDKLRQADKSYTKTNEFRNKISSATSGHNNPMYGKKVYDVWVEKYGKAVADRLEKKRRDKLSISFSGSNNPMYGKPAPNGSGNGWSGWYDGTYFRSLRELSYILHLETEHREWQTAENKEFAVKYVSFDGNHRTYRPDFLVDGYMLVECKPEKLWDTPTNERKRNAAIEFCLTNEYEYIVVDPVMVSTDTIKALTEDGKIVFLPKYKEKLDAYGDT